MPAEAQAAFRDNAQRQLQAVQTYAAADADADRNQGPRTWFHPADWDGDPHDLAGISEPFSRAPQEADFRQALEQGGADLDGALVQVQGDMLAAMERAFRSRHASSVRLLLHAGARRQGQGDDNGVIPVVLAGYLTHLEKLAKGS